ncbi:MAG TPA: hypothetical protein VGO56_08050 [Pyrinomonadaceae bacterium]|nr:hypothetical protein [Pyrinomonadaceae bacterium]
MPVRKSSSRTTRGTVIGMGAPPPAPPPPPMPVSFPNARSSGLFSAPKDAKYIDWTVMNGGIIGHWIRVKVYMCPVGAPKIAIAGPTAVFLDARVAAHEAVALIGAKPDRRSTYYEVVVEDEDMRMHPSVQLFRKYPADVIAGTLITPGDFAQTVP